MAKPRLKEVEYMAQVTQEVHNESGLTQGCLKLGPCSYHWLYGQYWSNWA